MCVCVGHFLNATRLREGAVSTLLYRILNKTEETCAKYGHSFMHSC